MADFKDTYAIETDSDTSGLDNAMSSISGFAGAATNAVSAIAGLGIVQDVAGFMMDSVTAGYEMEQQLNRIGDTTGLMGDELQEAKDIARDLWAVGFGESPQEVVDALSQVQNITGATGENLRSLTTDALALSKTFGFDIQESTRAANQLMEQFGVTGEQAFDIVAGVMQTTGDPAGDLLDTLQEYSSIFAEMGLSADEVAGHLVGAAEAGVFGYDKTADAMREFTIRFKEGSEEQEAAWNTLISKTDEFSVKAADGSSVAIKSFDDLNAKVADGTLTIADAGDMMRDALMEIEDPAERAALATTLVGTQFEDLGEDILAAFDDDGSLTNFDGTMASIASNTLKNISPMDRFKRGVQTFIGQAAMPLVAIVLDQINPAMEMFTEWLTGGGLDGVRDFTEALIDDLAPSMEEVVTIIQEVIAFVIGMIGQFQSFATANPEVIDFLVQLAETIAGVAAGFIAVSTVISGATAVFGAVGVAIALVTSPIFLLIAAAVALVTAYQTNFLGFRDIVNGAIAEIIPLIESLISWLQKIWDDVQPKLIELMNWFVANGIPAIIGAINDFKDNVIVPLIELLLTIWDAVQPGLAAFTAWFLSTGLPFIKLAVQIYIDEYIKPLINLLVTIYDVVSVGLNALLQWFLSTGLPFIKLAIQTLRDDYLSPLINLLSTIYGAVSIGLDLLKSWFTTSGMPAITTAIQSGIDKFNLFRDRVNTIWDAISGAINTMKSNFTGIFDDMWDAVNKVIGIVNDLISAISNIHFPDLPDLPNIPGTFAGNSFAGGNNIMGAADSLGALGGDRLGGGRGGRDVDKIVLHNHIYIDGEQVTHTVERVQAENPSNWARPNRPRIAYGGR